MTTNYRKIKILFLMLLPATAWAVPLPENRADFMYHFYKGDNVQVGGPALLVREDFFDRFSANVSYYVDNVSGASIDVRSFASEYDDTRTQYSAGLDFIVQDSIMNISFTSGEESDYKADTLDVGLTHEIFGGMTTVSLGYSRGWDDVGRSDTGFFDTVDRNSYRLGFSQILSPTWLTTLNYEAITDEGFLNNPYRPAVLEIIPGSPVLIPERYPRTRSSHAVSFGVLKYMQKPLRSSIKVDYRYFFDTWEISAHTMKTSYNMYLARNLIVDAHYRFYTQQKASFFDSAFEQEFNYMARDKELSTFVSHMIGVKASFEVNRKIFFAEKFTLNASLDFMRFNYKDFLDIENGNEPFSFNAEVVQVFISAWF